MLDWTVLVIDNVGQLSLLFWRCFLRIEIGFIRLRCFSHPLHRVDMSRSHEPYILVFVNVQVYPTAINGPIDSALFDIVEEKTRIVIFGPKEALLVHFGACDRFNS